MMNKQRESEHIKLLRRPRPPQKHTNQHNTHTNQHNTEDERRARTVLQDHDPQAMSPAPVTPAKILKGFPSQTPKIPPVSPSPPLFCLNDFLRLSQSARGSLTKLRNIILSTCNYKKLVNVFLLELHRGDQSELTNQTVSCEGLPAVKRRIPHTHVICELAAMVQLETRVRQQLRRSAERETRSHTRGSDTAHDLLNCVTSNYFQGSRRTRSPFQSGEGCDVISPSQLAVLDCLTRGGLNLNLKAHFISDLPDVMSLAHRLQYLNASFNDLTHVPHQLCDWTGLQVLKLRDNPIEEIPSEIHKLHRLHSLTISFCKIKHLPEQLYSLQCLQHLDVSYNLIRSISNDIRNLRCLKYLNVEGNQLSALPVGLLSVSACEVRLSGNYTHPILWRENSHNSPQSLLHTATHILAHTQQQWNSLPHTAQLLLHRSDTCDCCKGLMYGLGLKLIKPVHDVFGHQFVPVMFFSCSPVCHKSFRTHNNIITHHFITDDPNTTTQL